jgi:DNA-binding beta-propeller fold protein YncE
MNEDKVYYVYVVDGMNQRVEKFDNVGKLIYSIKEKGLMDHLRDPRGIAVRENGEFFVADTGAIPVAGYKADGTFFCSAGSFGKGRGKIIKPGGVAYSELDKRLYVTDYFQNKILIYSNY